MLESSNALAGADNLVTLIVVKLLQDAGAILEGDRAAAKACLARASALLQAAQDRQSADAAVAQADSITRGGLAPWQIRRVKNYIQENLESAIRLEELSEITSLSKSYFTRAFKESFGISPHAHVNRQRIARAQEIMLTTEEPLSHISVICGLCDQAHFSKLFRRVVGISPNAWRRQHRVAPSEVKV